PDRGCNRRHGAEVLSEFVMKLARQMPALLLLIVDQLGSESGLFAGRQLEVRRQPVEYLANALKFDKPEAWKPAREVAARQRVETGQNFLRRTQGAPDRHELQETDRPDHQRRKAEETRHNLPDRSQHGGLLRRH